MFNSTYLPDKYVANSPDKSFELEPVMYMSKISFAK